LKAVPPSEHSKKEVIYRLFLLFASKRRVFELDRREASTSRYSERRKGDCRALTATTKRMSGGEFTEAEIPIPEQIDKNNTFMVLFFITLTICLI